jgi:DNA-binding IclR family transcriptional regulator
MELLRLVAAAPDGLRLKDIVDRSGLQKSTAHNLLRTLLAGNFLFRDEEGYYFPGDALSEMAGVRVDRSLRRRIGRELLELHKKFPEDVLTVATFERSAIRCVLRVSPDRPGIVQTPENQTFSAYVSLSALALHTHWAAMIERSFPFGDFGEDMWATPENFHRVLQTTRQQGYCWKKKMKLLAAAFIMPEGWVLGFCLQSEQVIHDSNSILKARKLAADEFCSRIWSLKQ